MDNAAFEDSFASATHPTSPFYRRGKSFDRSVVRGRAAMVCLHDAMLNMGQESYDVLGTESSFRYITVSRGIISKEMASKFRSWWIKPLAMYYTDVRHVMLLDVDDVILKDPAIVRSLDGYVKTGTTFFYDRVITQRRFLTGNDSGEMYVHKLLREFDYARFNVSKGLAPSQQMLNTFAHRGKSIHEMDSSMVLIDKKRAGKTVMDILFWFITEERFRFTYSWGDKETFRLAFEMARAPYFFRPWGYMPVQGSDDEEAEILYMNGKALIDPYPQGIGFIQKAKQNNLFNTVPTHMTPRQQRRQIDKAGYPGKKFNTGLHLCQKPVVNS
ncbi:putative Mannosyltransferase [Phytophthora infestans]|uniref:Putative Mannosyltransferase n=1 Tax=Phytophthora infestans TaxID=4787 RepID=A0A8S9TYY0_PHYIN|nr:putative Mannosyltransferase [Phytophthora infestans]